MGNSPNFRKSSATSAKRFTAFPELSKPFYTISETALLIAKSEDSVSRWCKIGKLPAIPERYGSRMSYKIPQASIRLWLQDQAAKVEQQETLRLVAQQRAKAVPQKDLIEKFKKACLQGVLTGRPFSPYTVRYYADHLTRFYEGHKVLTYDTLKDRLLEIPAEQFATRDKLHKAAVCFAKFLATEGQADAGLAAELKPLKPKRHKPPKRITVAEDGLSKMLEACGEALEDRLIVTLLAHTGLRAGEYGSLKVKDVDLANRTLIVRCGKGGKARTVGLTSQLTELLRAWLTKTGKGPDDLLHPNDLGQQMTKDGVYQRVRRIGDAAGVPAASHALRRAFVTLNANKGRSLVMLQMACGHSDIKTTRDYCRTSEQELIAAMQAWE